MKPNCIIVTDRGIGCIEVPEKVKHDYGASRKWEENKALEHYKSLKP